jgi:peroxiredoxin
MALSAGAKAPDFTLMTTPGLGDSPVRPIKLSDHFGKSATVLLFFPAAFTGVCTKEMCDVSAGLGAYQALNATVYGISVDTPFAQQAWAKKENISISLLSDLNKSVAKAYDVIIPNLLGIGDVAARAVFVIDKEGTILYSEQTPSPRELPNFEKVKAALA